MKQIIAVLLLLLVLFCLSSCSLLVVKGRPAPIEAAPAVTESTVVVEEMPVETGAPVDAPAEETETDR